MREAESVILHEVNGKYYLEYLAGHVLRVRKATNEQTEALLERIIKQDPHALTGAN